MTEQNKLEDTMDIWCVFSPQEDGRMPFYSEKEAIDEARKLASAYADHSRTYFIGKATHKITAKIDVKEESL